MKSFILFLLIVLLMCSCAQIFNGFFLVNQCKKCDLIDRYFGKIVYSVEGCGSQNTDLRGQCESEAWDISRGQHLCDFEITCKTWKSDKL